MSRASGRAVVLHRRGRAVAVPLRFVAAAALERARRGDLLDGAREGDVVRHRPRAGHGSARDVARVVPVGVLLRDRPVQVLDHELGALTLSCRTSGGHGVVLRRVVRQRLTLALPANVPLLVLVVDLDRHGHGVPITCTVKAHAQEQARRDIRASAASRGPIEQAKGILTGVLGVDPEESFQMLKRASNEHNVPLRDLARLVVDEASCGRGSAEHVTNLLT